MKATCKSIFVMATAAAAVCFAAGGADASARRPYQAGGPNDYKKTVQRRVAPAAVVEGKLADSRRVHHVPLVSLWRHLGDAPLAQLGGMARLAGRGTVEDVGRLDGQWQELGQCLGVNAQAPRPQGGRPATTASCGSGRACRGRCECGDCQSENEYRVFHAAHYRTSAWTMQPAIALANGAPKMLSCMRPFHRRKAHRRKVE